MQDFEDKVAVVTGAGSGMGKAFALRFGAEDMKVVVADIDGDALDATVAELRAGGHEALGVVTDVSDAAAVRRLAEETTKAFGTVHLLCNNAGVEGYLDGPIWEATDKDWTWTVGVNFWSVVHGIRTFVPIMLEHGEPAHVVNTASMTAVVAAENLYGVTKHAVLALSELLAADLAKRSSLIGVTALCPGTIATELFHGSRNRPDHLRNDTPTSGTQEGLELRERMHAVLAAGMSPAEVADKLVDAVRSGSLYLLTDREWNDRIVTRNDAILASALPSRDRA